MTPRLLFAMLALAGVCEGASFTPIAQPTAGYTATTRLLPLAGDEFSLLTETGDGNLTVAFFANGVPLPMILLTVPDDWSSWGIPPDAASGTPRVLWSDTESAASFVFSFPVWVFGMELQPNDTDVHTITASFYLDQVLMGSIGRNVSGNGGALLFAATGGPFNRVDISSDTSWAAAELRYDVPEPATAIGCALAMGMMLLKRRLQS